MTNQEKIATTDQEWKKKLTPEAYHILRQGGTEPAFSGAYHRSKSQGVYTCAGCGQSLFSSDTKFDSGTGWPSFYAPVSTKAVEEKTDWSLLIPRREILCRRCGGHLGHVFSDGPKPTGQRYCLNSGALNFSDVKEEK